MRWIHPGGGGARRRNGASSRRATGAGIRPRRWRGATVFTPVCCSSGGVGMASRRPPAQGLFRWWSRRPSRRARRRPGAWRLCWAARCGWWSTPRCTPRRWRGCLRWWRGDDAGSCRSTGVAGDRTASSLMYRFTADTRRFSRGRPFHCATVSATILASASCSTSSVSAHPKCSGTIRCRSASRLRLCSAPSRLSPTMPVADCHSSTHHTSCAASIAAIDPGGSVRQSCAGTTRTVARSAKFRARTHSPATVSVIHSLPPAQLLSGGVETPVDDLDSAGGMRGWWRR